MPPWGAWTGVGMMLVPTLIAWIGARLLLRSSGRPFLRERLHDYNLLLGVTSAWLFIAVIVATRLNPAVALLIIMIFTPAGTFPLREPLFQERWGLLGYVGFQTRMAVAFFGFWLLLAIAPPLVAAAAPGARWIAAGATAAAILLWSTFYVPILRALIRARPLRTSDLEARFDAIIAKSDAPRPVTLEISPPGGNWWNAVAIPRKRSPLILFGGGVLDVLTAEESTAIFAHELAHVEQRKERRMQRFFASLVPYAGVLACAAAARFAPASAMMTLVWLLVVMLSHNRLRANSQRWELAADRRAAELCGDPELVARALTRLHAFMRLPTRWAQEQQKKASHPDLAARVAALLPRSAAPAAIQPVTLSFATPPGMALVFDAEGCHWITGQDDGSPVDIDGWRAAHRPIRSFKHGQISEITVSPGPTGIAVKLLTGIGTVEGAIALEHVGALEQALGTLDRRIKVIHHSIFRSALRLSSSTATVVGVVLGLVLGLSLIRSISGSVVGP